MIQPKILDKYSKKSYPMKLLRLMKRQAEDLLLGDTSDEQGKAALTFIKNVAKEKNGAGIDILKKGILRNVTLMYHEW